MAASRVLHNTHTRQVPALKSIKIYMINKQMPQLGVGALRLCPRKGEELGDNFNSMLLSQQEGEDLSPESAELLLVGDPPRAPHSRGCDTKGEMDKSYSVLESLLPASLLPCASTELIIPRPALTKGHTLVQAWNFSTEGNP